MFIKVRAVACEVIIGVLGIIHNVNYPPFKLTILVWEFEN
jgi:hypothetical protein